MRKERQSYDIKEQKDRVTRKRKTERKHHDLQKDKQSKAKGYKQVRKLLS